MSSDESARISRISELVSPGLALKIKPEMAAAWGAAADVPKKVLNPGVEVLTPSAAAISGFWRSLPPVERKLPGVTGVPSGS